MQGQGMVLHISDVISSHDFIKKERNEDHYSEDYQVKRELTEDVSPPYLPNPQLYSGQNVFSQYPQNHQMYQGQMWNPINSHPNPVNWQNQVVGMPVDFNGDHSNTKMISQSENNLININNNTKNNHESLEATAEKKSPPMRRNGRNKSEWVTDDETLPTNWRKRCYQVNHTGTKSGKATLFEYLSPSNIIFASRSKVVLHLKQDGRYSQEEINKVQKGRISYGNNQKINSKEHGNSQKIITNEHVNNQKVVTNEDDNNQMRRVTNEHLNGIPNLLNSANYSNVMNNSSNIIHDISNEAREVYNPTDSLTNITQSVPGNNLPTFFNDAYNGNISTDSMANFLQYSNSQFIPMREKEPISQKMFFNPKDDEQSEQLFFNDSNPGISNYGVEHLINASNNLDDSTAFLSQHFLAQSIPESQSQQLFFNTDDGAPDLINPSSHSNNSFTNTQDTTSQFVHKNSKQSKLTLTNHSNHENRSRYSAWEADPFLPTGWKKRFSENKNRNMKNGKATKYQYLSPMQEIITSRAEVIEYMIRSGIYSEEDILKVKKGRAKNVRKSPLKTVNDKRLEICDSIENYNGSESSTELTSENQRFDSNFENYADGNGHENLLEKLNKITYTKFQESSPTVSHFPNNQRYTDEENKSDNQPENLPAQLTTESDIYSYNNGFTADDDLMSGYDTFARVETVMNKSQGSLMNNEKAMLMKPAGKREKRKRIERTEWELEEYLPYGWKKRSFENIWNKNGEKLIFKKYEYLSPSENIFSTRISVLAHMQELPSVYSEEQILNFKQSYGIRRKSSNSGNFSNPTQGADNTNSQWMENPKNNVIDTEANSLEYNNFEDNTEDKKLEDTIIAYDRYDNFREQPQDISTEVGEISYSYDNMDGEIKDPTNDVHIKIPRLNYTLESNAEDCKINDIDIPNNRYGNFKEQSQDINYEMSKSDNIELERNSCYKKEGGLESEESITDVVTEIHSLKNSEDCKVSNTVIPYGNFKEQNQDINNLVSEVGEISYPYDNMEGDFEIKEHTGDVVNTNISRLNYTLEYDAKDCKVNDIDIPHNRYGNFKEQSQDNSYEVSKSDNIELENNSCYKKQGNLDIEEFITDVVKTETHSLNNSEDCKLNDTDIPYKKYGNFKEQNQDINDNAQLEEFSNHYETDIDQTEDSLENNEYTINSNFNNNWIKNRDKYMDIGDSFSYSLLNGSEELMEDSINDYNYGMVWCNFMKDNERFNEFSDDNMTDKSYKNDKTTFLKFQELYNINGNNNSCKNTTDRSSENCSDSFLNNSETEKSYEDSIITNDSIADSEKLVERTSNDEVNEYFNNDIILDKFSISEVSNISFNDTMESLEENDSANHREDKLSTVSSDHSFNSNFTADDSKLFNEYDTVNLNRSDDISRIYIDNNSEMSSNDNLNEDLETSFGSFSDNHELSNDTDNSKLSPNHSPDNFIMSYNVNSEKSPNLADNFKLSIDKAGESMTALNIPANDNILNNSDTSEDNNDLTIPNPDEFDTIPRFLGPAITINIGDFSILTLLFTNNPHPSQLEIDDISEDMEISPKDIKWAFIKLREKFQTKKGQTVDSKPVKELVEFFQSKYGQNSFVF